MSGSARGHVFRCLRSLRTWQWDSKNKLHESPPRRLPVAVSSHTPYSSVLKPKWSPPLPVPGGARLRDSSRSNVCGSVGAVIFICLFLMINEAEHLLLCLLDLL